MEILGGDAASGNNVLSGQGGQTGKWPYGIAHVPDLISRQKYDVVVAMRLPRSKANLRVGNWMIGVELRGPSTGSSTSTSKSSTAGESVRSILGWDEDGSTIDNVQDHSVGSTPGSSTTTKVGRLNGGPILARSKRPALLTYRSSVVEHAYRLLRLPLYLVGWHTESEHISTNMMDGIEFSKGTNNVPSSIKLELRSKHPLEIYTVAVRFSAKLEGLRWVMYKYWLSSAIVGIGLFWGVEVGVLLVTWGLVTLLFGGSRGEHEGMGHDKKRIKQETSGARRIKREEEDGETDPGTPMSDASRTFPTLPSQAPLRYSAPKEESQERKMDDIPPHGDDVEADDEDDDFVLEEPVPLRTEREGVFTDSGLGTGIESGREAGGRGLARRRSGRLKDENGEQGGQRDRIDR